MLTPLSPSSDVIAPIIPGRFWLMRQRRVCWLESGASAVLGKLTELVTAPSSRKRASCAAAASSSLAIGGAQLVLLRGAVGEQACCHLPAVTTA